MGGSYPDFQSSYTHEELVEQFLLTPAELALVFTCRGEANRCGMALLLKTLPYLGYVPDGLAQIPPEVRTFVAGQLGLLWDHSAPYAWDSRTRDQHLFLVRKHTGWQPPTAQDKDELAQWLRQEAAYKNHTTEDLFNAACQRLRHLQVELPAEGELLRVVSTGLNSFFQDLQCMHKGKQTINEKSNKQFRRHETKRLFTKTSRAVVRPPAVDERGDCTIQK